MKSNKRKIPANEHLAVVFNEILPILTRENIKYWVYGGIGIAGIVKKFFRINQDVDIYVLNNNFAKVGRILKYLCKKHGGLDGDDWALRYSITKRTRRPKWDLLVKGNELVSAIPVYVTKKGVEFRVYNPFLLPEGALSQKLKKVGEFKFYSPSADVILYLFRILLEQYVAYHEDREPIDKTWKYLIDARTVLPKKEVSQFIARYNKNLN